MQNQPNKEGSIIGYPNRLFLDPNHFETHFRDLPGPGRVISEPRPTLNQRTGEVSDSSFTKINTADALNVIAVLECIGFHAPDALEPFFQIHWLDDLKHSMVDACHGALDDEIRNITGELQNQQDGDNLDG